MSQNHNSNKCVKSGKSADREYKATYPLILISEIR